MKAGRRPLRGLLLALAVAIAALAYALGQGHLRIEDRWKPWTPLRIDDRPNLLTPLKLRRLAHDAPLCRAVLATTGFRYTALPDRETGPGCGFDNAVQIRATGVAVGAPFSLSCRAAVSLALWERHSLQPEARARLGQPVARIEHFGSYACRNVYGRPDARRSRHATADAFDVAGFVLADGRRIRVRGDWDGDSAEARFLHAVHRGACRWFDTVLGPDYNAAHADHLHLDRGRFGLCR
ncbi:extensin family protein [Dokdonella koreensis]|uniref:Extensin family protein n=1 Tax=Dokdonella koreensis DS-123 TaxID=1300342 RepID=A0A167GDX5_9GAMM|nr:extensin family protein [Dokdonella koreensis]ANB16456.1 Extensin family protein [Dokdonella koreensis DS-123]